MKLTSIIAEVHNEGVFAANDQFIFARFFGLKCTRPADREVLCVDALTWAIMSKIEMDGRIHTIKFCSAVLSISIRIMGLQAALVCPWHGNRSSGRTDRPGSAAIVWPSNELNRMRGGPAVGEVPFVESIENKCRHLRRLRSHTRVWNLLPASSR